jgi:exopolysaccharide production protein ExoQ
MLAPRQNNDGGSGKRPRGAGVSIRAALPSRAGLIIIAFLAIIILTLLGPLMTIDIGGALGGEGNVPRQIAYILSFGLAIFAVRPLTSPERLLTVPIPLAVALLWCWLSLTWAIDPGIAFRRLVLTTVIIWSIFILVRQLGYERTVTILRYALVVLLVANFLTVIAAPQTGIHQSSEPFDRALVGNWRGIMMQKNLAGLTSALTILLFAFDAQRIKLAIRVVVIAAAAFFLFKTSSKTSVGVCVAAILFGLAYLSISGRYRIAVLSALGFAALGGAIYVNAYEYMIFQVVGDQTFTGRTLIWEALTRYSEDHPLLGSGYGSFWNIGPSSPIYQYANNWVTTLATGHNGFLDILAAVGIPGLIIVVVATVIWPSIRLFMTSAGQQGALVAAVFLFCVIHNMSETSLFDRDAIGQVFLMIAIALIGVIGATKPSRGFSLNKSKRGSNPAFL